MARLLLSIGLVLAIARAHQLSDMVVPEDQSLLVEQSAGEKCTALSPMDPPGPGRDIQVLQYGSRQSTTWAPENSFDQYGHPKYDQFKCLPQETDYCYYCVIEPGRLTRPKRGRVWEMQYETKIFTSLEDAREFFYKKHMDEYIRPTNDNRPRAIIPMYSDSAAMPGCLDTRWRYPPNGGPRQQMSRIADRYKMNKLRFACESDPSISEALHTAAHEHLDKLDAEKKAAAEKAAAEKAAAEKAAADKAAAEKAAADKAAADKAAADKAAEQAAADKAAEQAAADKAAEQAAADKAAEQAAAATPACPFTNPENDQPHQPLYHFEQAQCPPKDEYCSYCVIDLVTGRVVLTQTLDEAKDFWSQQHMSRTRRPGAIVPMYNENAGNPMCLDYKWHSNNYGPQHMWFGFDYYNPVHHPHWQQINAMRYQCEIKAH